VSETSGFSTDTSPQETRNDRDTETDGGDLGYAVLDGPASSDERNDHDNKKCQADQSKDESGKNAGPLDGRAFRPPLLLLLPPCVLHLPLTLLLHLLLGRILTWHLRANHHATSRMCHRDRTSPRIDRQEAIGISGRHSTH
jgi:hypothetical protein